MKNDPWRRRLKDAGLTQRDIARRLEWEPTSVARALSRAPTSPIIVAIIEAAEIMTDEQRALWLNGGKDDGST
jgi:transcriptional regulator with XRE-family HTH domain